MEFFVEKILAHRGDVGRLKTLAFHVKWRGFDESFNSWEPWKNSMTGLSDLWNSWQHQECHYTACSTRVFITMQADVISSDPPIVEKKIGHQLEVFNALSQNWI